MALPLPNNIEIRQATADDAASFLELLHQVDSETEYLLYEPGERTTTESQMRDRLGKAFDSATIRNTIALDVNSQSLVGFCWSGAGMQIRKQHELSLAIAIVKSHHGLGIGSALVEAQIAWAHQHGFHRIELSVSTLNQSAIHVYEKAGFIIEGKERDSIKLTSGYDDSYIMGLLLNDS